MKLQDYLEKYGNVSVDEKELNEVLGVKSRGWNPKYRETYWYLNIDGGIGNYDWVGDGIDQGILKYSEVYKSREEAEFARDKQKFLLKMKRDFEDNTDEINWEDKNQRKCYLSDDYGDGEFVIPYRNRHRTQGTLYTTNVEWLKQYIEDNGEVIRKYVFEL